MAFTEYAMPVGWNSIVCTAPNETFGWIRRTGPSRFGSVTGFASAAVALALLFTSQVWIDYNYVGRPLSWGQALLVALIDWELWTILAPAVVRLSERVSFSRRRWRLALAVHLPAGIIIVAVKLATEGFIVSLVIGAGRGPFSFLKIHLTLLTYWGIVAATRRASCSTNGMLAITRGFSEPIWGRMRVTSGAM